MSKRIITLGTWEGKPIEWLVLKEEGFATFCVSKIVLFTHCYNDDGNKGNDYAKSDIRKYLNSNFFKTAFSDVEKKKIINVKNTDFNTKDNIFLLSKNEAEKLMTQNERTHAISIGCCLRTVSSHGSLYIWRIGHDGGFDDYGHYESYSYVYKPYGIRPAMWIKEK